MLCIMAVFILAMTEDFTLTEIIFEVCSAFGSVGLSMGITSELSNIGKIVIMIIMFYWKGWDYFLPLYNRS